MGEKVKITLDMDEMDFDELELFEDLTGLIMSEAVKTVTVRDKDNRPVADPDDPKGRPLREVRMSAKAMKGMVFIAMRRDNPELTWAEVGKLKLSDIDFNVTESVDDEGNSDTPE